MRRWLAFLLLSNLLLLAARPLTAADVEINDVSAYYSYGKTVTFQARVKSDTPIKDVFLFIQPTGQQVRVQKVSLTEDNQIIYDYDLTKNPLRPFARVLYWFRADLENGQESTTPSYWFDYDDNRFQWQSLKDGPFEVLWYGRGVEFGQEVMNVAQDGIKAAQRILPAPLNSNLRIFVYATADDFRQALQLSGQSWMAGHASPDLNAIILSIPSGAEERLELERQLPHELTHILQYQLVGDDYSRIPTWFLEGSASLAELYPNPDYQNVLSSAAKKDSLIPLDQLCGPFPREASGAFLAYAESTSFLHYLHQKYGTSGVGSLMKRYQDGVGCKDGPVQPMGATLNELEYRWRQETLGMNMQALVLGNLSPYFALLGVLILVPLAFAGVSFLKTRPE
jgi:hypothetical protein